MMGLPELQARTEEELIHFKAFAERLELLASEIVERLAEQTIREHYRHVFENESTGAGTDVTVAIGPVPAGTTWEIRRIGVTGGVDGPCAIYLNEQAPHRLIDLIADAELAAYGPRNLIYVGQGEKLLFHFYAQPNNEECTVSVQLREYVDQPGHLGSDGGN